MRDGGVVAVRERRAEEKMVEVGWREKEKVAVLDSRLKGKLLVYVVVVGLVGG